MKKRVFSDAEETEPNMKKRIFSDAEETEPPSTSNTSLVIPLTKSTPSNQAIFKNDLDYRPSDPTTESYQKIPVQDFGLALLKGMGYREGMVVGKSQKNAVFKPREMKLRPPMLGLGAEHSEFALTEKEEKIRMQKERREGNRKRFMRQEQDLVKVVEEGPRNKVRKIEKNCGNFLVGDEVVVVDGRQEGWKGVVLSIKESKNNGDMVVKIKLDNGDELKVWEDQICLRSVSKKEKSISSTSTTTGSLSRKFWVKRSLLIRIISESFGNGKFYNQKGIVEEIFVDNSFSIRISKTNELVEGVMENQVETVIPKVGKIAMIVRNEDPDLVGQTAKVIEDFKKKEQCIVQTLEDFITVTVKYDDLCEYVDHDY